MTDPMRAYIDAVRDERLLTPGEVARLFRVDVKTVSRWAARGRLASVRTPGNHHRFRESDILPLLEWLREGGDDE